MPDDINSIKQQLLVVMNALKCLTHKNTTTSAQETSSNSVESIDSVLLDTGDEQSSIHSDVDESDDDELDQTHMSLSAGSPPQNQEGWQKARRQRQLKKKRDMKRTTANHPKTAAAFQVTILSDSMLRNIDISRTEALCSEANCNIKVIHEAGDIGSATDFVQDTYASRDDPVIIHTGTNHVERESLQTTIQRLERLEWNLVKQRYSRVALSSIVYRRSHLRSTHEKISALNNVLLSMCSRNNWTYIDNDNLDEA
jgi:hypothetical protein